MSRRCSICDHHLRDDIDERVVRSREPFRRIASDLAVSEPALRRHARNHLPKTMALAIRDEEASRGESLARTADDLLGRALRLLAQAEADGDRKGALQAIKECRGVVETLGRLVGSIDTGVHLSVNANGSQVIQDVTDFRRLLAELALTQAGGLPPARPMLEAPAADGAAPIEDLEA